MSGRILAICEGDAGAIHHGAAAAAGLAQKFASESAGACDVLMAGGAPVPPGRWERAWSCEAASAAACDAAATIIKAGEYTLIAAGDTPLLREVAGRLAVRLGLPVLGAVLALKRRDGELVATRTAAGGSRTVNFVIRRFPALVVVNPEAAAAAAATAGAEAPGAEVVAGVQAAPPFPLLQEERLSPWEMNVTDAGVVVAGGRGAGGKAGFEMLGELAALLGGSVGGSRVAVDLGWVPYARQVGLTGKSVAPRLYIACGISGAIHHTLGMRDSSFIVAINSDARAPIFKIANVAIVGDVSEVIPNLIADLKARSPGAPRLAAVAGVAP